MSDNRHSVRWPDGLASRCGQTSCEAVGEHGPKTAAGTRQRAESVVRKPLTHNNFPPPRACPAPLGTTLTLAAKMATNRIVKRTEKRQSLRCQATLKGKTRTAAFPSPMANYFQHIIFSTTCNSSPEKAAFKRNPAPRAMLHCCSAIPPRELQRPPSMQAFQAKSRRRQFPQFCEYRDRAID